MRRILTLLLLVAMLMSAGCSQPPSTDGREDAGPPDSTGPDLLYSWPARWHVSRGFIRDAQGRAVIMHGMNLAGSHKNKPYTGTYTEADVAVLSKQWGMNSVRLLISWSAVEPAKGQYDTTYLDKMATRVDWAAKAGLIVVLDSHQDVYGEGFSHNGAPRWTCSEANYKAHKPASSWFLEYTSPQVMACFDGLFSTPALGQAYAAMWAQVAKRLKGHANIVGFDVINEPHWGSYNVYTFEKDRLQPFYDRVVKAVRAEAPEWVAFLEPANSRNLGFKTSLEPFAYPDTVYAPHSYDTVAEQGGGFDQSRRAALIYNITALAKEAAALKSALWIGEYGGVAENKGIDKYMDANYDAAGAVAASNMYWDYGRGGGYNPLDKDGKEKKVLLDAIVRPYPRRVAGDPSSYAFDEKTRAFSLTYRPTSAITAPTLIATPARVYPSSYKVSCGGCVYNTKTAGTLEITKPGAGETVTITVTP